MCTCACECSSCRGHKKASYCLELELWAIVSSLNPVLGIEIRLSARTEHSLNHYSFSPTLILLLSS